MATHNQLPFFGLMPVSDWRPPDLSALPQDWSNIPRISLDVETKDPDIRDLGCGALRDGCHVAGFGIGFEYGPGDYRCHYLPVRHEGGGNMELDQVRRYLGDRLRTYTGRVVGAELPYDMAFCLSEGLAFHPDLKLHDVATDSSLLNEHADGFTLDKCAKRSGLKGKDEALLRAAASFYPGGSDNPKSVIYRMHSKYAGPYGEEDVRLPFLIDDAQQPLLEKEGLLRASDLEASFAPVTVYSRRWGIQIDQDALARVIQWATAGQQARCAQFKHLTGIEVDMEVLRSPIAMQTIIQRLGLPDLPITRRFNRKTKEYEDGQPSIKSEILKAYRDDRINLLSDARKLDKILTTYGPSILRYMVNGRVHGTLKSVRGTRDGGEGDDDDQAGTVSRRCAHVHPNLGNQPNPTRDEDDALRVLMGTMWRSIFVPDDGCDWGLGDLSQQEPRWIVHDAEGLNLKGARQMADAFRNDPRTDNHKRISELTHLPRGPAKITFLARCYGAGMAKIARQMEDKLRELDLLLRTDPSNPKVPPGWRPLPEGWQPTYEAIYQPGDWVPPHKCVGDTYDKPSIECADIIRQFDSYAPYVKQLARACSDRAKERGYILLIDGGRARLEPVGFGGYGYKDEHKALNKRAQGNGAVQLKLILVALYRAGLLHQMTVHDDFSRSVPHGEEGTRQLLAMKEIGECAVPYVSPAEYASHPGPYKSRVPWLIKVKRGTSYGTADAAKEINV